MNNTPRVMLPSSYNLNGGQSLKDFKYERDIRDHIFSDVPYPEPTFRDLQRPTLKLEFQGKFVAAAVRYPSDRKWKRGQRGCITSFSDQSRRRLFDLVHRLDVKRKPIFLTLTYGNDYPDAETAKIHLKTLLERIRKKLDGLPVSAIWRMEFQERGAPHFHVIFFDLPFIDKLTWQYWWEEITGHPEPFTRVERVRSHKHLMSYISKYIAKVDKAEKTGFISPTYLHAYQQKHGELIGRQWGVFQRQYLPFAECVILERDLTGWAFDCFRELAACQFEPIRGYLSPGFRLYVRDAEQWLAIARYLFDRPRKTKLLSRLRQSDLPLTL